MAREDIIINVISEEGKKKIEEFADSLHKFSWEEGHVAREAEEMRLGTAEAATGMMDLGMQMREAGIAAAEVQRELGLTRDQMLELGYTARELTGLFGEQGVELMRIPSYIMGYRGGWLNLVATLVFGISIFKVLHDAIESVTNKLTEGYREHQKLRETLLETNLTYEDYIRYLEISTREKEKESAAAREFNEMQLVALGYTREMIDELKEQSTEQERAANLTAYQTAWMERLNEEYGKLIAQDADKEFEAQKEAIFEASTSAEDYASRILALLMLQEKIPVILDASTRAWYEQGLMLEFNAMQAEKAREAFERLMAIQQAVGGVTEQVGDFIRDLGDIQEQYADRVEDTLFRAGQAWEAYQFRVAQAVAAFDFRLLQAQEKFDYAWTQRQEKAQHAAASSAARAAVSAGAAAARHALDIESIRQDHYDKLEDMERQHQEEMRRFLQKAPYYLQRHVREYQGQRKALEERGDKEGLARLEKNFIERMRTIDPIFAEELEHLKDLQQDERNVEEREFQQRLRRSEAQFGISRAQAAAQSAIALSDAEFALRQQNEAAIFADEQALKAREFAHEQQLAAMEFAHKQQAEASGRAYVEALEDQKEAQEDRIEEFDKWAKGWVKRWYFLGREAGIQYGQGFYETTGVEPPEARRPRPPTWPPKELAEYQRGLPYVPTTMPVVVHPGEAILRREEAAAWRGGGGNVIYIQFLGPVYMRTREEVKELANDISRELGRQAMLRR